MAFAWCVRKSASKLASVCGRVRSISAVMNRSSLALKPSPLSPFVSRGFLYTMAVDQLTSEQNLLLVIDSELNSALQTNDHDLDEEMTPDSFPFTIKDNPGDQSVLFTRQDNEEELIRVSVDLAYLDDDDVMDAFGPRTPREELFFPLTATVMKKSGLTLEFAGFAFPNYIDIRCLTVNHPKELENDWPPLKNLDDNLKKALKRYLATRVEASTAKYLHKYMISKMKREYLLYLKNVRKFVDE